MVLRLRLRAKAEQIVKAAVEGGVEGLERDLNNGMNWMFQQSERRWFNGKCVDLSPLPVLLSGRYKLVLLPQSDKSSNFHYDILTILMANKTDRIDALNGQQVDEQIKLLPSSTRAWPRPRDRATASSTNESPSTTNSCAKTPAETDSQRFIITPTCPSCRTVLVPCRGIYCQHCGLKLPSDLAVHPEVVVAIKRPAYDKLATHLKQKANVAWSQLLRGRRVDETLNSMGQTLFIISVEDETRTSTLTDEQRLDSTLTGTGIGRLTSDPYELKEAHRIMDRKPSAQPA